MDDIPETDDVSQLLHYAVEKGRTDIVRALLEKGALEQIKSAGGAVDTPALHTACRLGHEDVVRALLSSGADPTEAHEGKLALQCAASPKVAQIFSMELFTATAQGDAQRVQLLLNARVHVDTDDQTDALNTPLHWAASFGSLPVVQVLLHGGASPNIRNAAGITALHEAAKAGSASIVAALMEAGADTAVEGTAGRWNQKSPMQVTGDEEVRRLLADKSPGPAPSEAAPASPPPAQLFAHPDYRMLWPRPKQVHELNSHPVVLSSSGVLFVWLNPCCAHQQGMRTWRLLRDAFSQAGCHPVMCTAPDSSGAAVALRVCPELFTRREEYSLQLVDGRVVLTGADQTGLFYAGLTLVQLLKHYSTQEEGALVLPPLRVRDWPDLLRRGVMLDLRTRCLGLSDLCSTAEMLCTLKVNELHLYLERTLFMDAHPTVRAAAGLSSADVIELHHHCAGLGLLLVLHQSCLELPGWLAQDRYASLGSQEAPGALEPHSTEGLRLVRSVLDHVLSLPAHTGMVGVGLEMARGLSQEGQARYVQHVGAIQRMLAREHRLMLLWGDNPCLLPQRADPNLPPDCIVMVRGLGADPHQAYERGCSRLAEQGVPFYVSMPTPGWTGQAGGLESTLDRITAATTKGMKYGALGGLVADFAAESSEGLIDDMATSLLGVLVGVGCMWNGSTAQLLDQALLASLVATHLLGSSLQEHLGRAIVSLASCHVASPGSPSQALSPPPSALMKLLVFEGEAPALEGLDQLSLKRASLVITGCIEALSNAPEQLSGSLELNQVLMAADLQHFGCQLGLALLAAQDRTKQMPVKIADIPKLITTDLLANLKLLKQRVCELWKKRHQLAGCPEVAPNCLGGLDHLESLFSANIASGGGTCVLC